MGITFIDLGGLATSLYALQDLNDSTQSKLVAITYIDQVADYRRFTEHRQMHVEDNNRIGVDKCQIVPGGRQEAHEYNQLIITCGSCPSGNVGLPPENLRCPCVPVHAIRALGNEEKVVCFVQQLMIYSKSRISAINSRDLRLCSIADRGVGTETPKPCDMSRGIGGNRAQFLHQTLLCGTYRFLSPSRVSSSVFALRTSA